MDHSPNNSGSMQSSSSDDHRDYDSRNESISPLFMINSSSFGSISNNHPYPPPPPPPPQPQPQPQPQPTTFLEVFDIDPDQLQHHPPAANQLDLVWSRSSETMSYSTLGNFTPLLSSSSSTSSSSSFPPPSTQSQLGLSLTHDQQGPKFLQSLLVVDGGNYYSPSPRVAAPNSVSDHKISQTTNVDDGKTSRKRTRASRRAPTTVISTDASNFRHMVQEFTGPPFSASPYLHLFAGSNPRSGHLDALGPIYPFRPSAQKVQQNPLVSSTPSSSLFNTTTTTIASTSNSNGGAHTFPSNYQMNRQNPVLLNNSTFQSLLQTNGSHLGTKSQGSLGIVSMDRELDGGQQHVSATSLSEFSILQVGGSNNNSLTRSIWRGKEGANDHDQDRRLGSFNGSNGVPQNGIGNSSGSGSSDFVTGKRMENLSSRNEEGMVDSWICPSD